MTIPNENIRFVIDEAVATILNGEIFNAGEAIDQLREEDVRFLAAEGISYWVNQNAKEDEPQHECADKDSEADLLSMMREGEILGFKRTSTFALWGSFGHTSASYDVYVDALNGDDEATIRERLAGNLNTDPCYIRVVAEEMCEGDYPDHFRKKTAA